MTFSIGSVALFVFRNVGLGGSTTRLRGMKVVAPTAFAVSSLVILWQSWDTLWKTLIPIAAGLVWFAVSFAFGRRNAGDLAGGIWLVVYVAFVYAVAGVGSYGGAGWVPSPWDSILVAVGALATYWWGVQAGTKYLRNHPNLLETLKSREGAELTAA